MFKRKSKKVIQIFPNVLYALREEVICKDDDEDETFLISETVEDHCEIGKTVKLGVYKLIRVLEVEEVGKITKSVDVINQKHSGGGGAGVNNKLKKYMGAGGGADGGFST